MRSTSFILFLLLSSSLAFCQSKDEQLYDAVSKSDSIKVEALLKDGANANYRKKLMSFEASLLILAVQHHDLKIVKLLISYKADVNFKDWFQTTALIYAAAAGDKSIVNALLSDGADPTADDGQGNSVLSAAKESHN